MYPGQIILRGAGVGGGHILKANVGLGGQGGGTGGQLPPLPPPPRWRRPWCIFVVTSYTLYFAVITLSLRV